MGHIAHPAEPETEPGPTSAVLRALRSEARAAAREQAGHGSQGGGNPALPPFEPADLHDRRAASPARHLPAVCPPSAHCGGTPRLRGAPPPPAGLPAPGAAG
jgi:hypothetical protein